MESVLEKENSTVLIVVENMLSKMLDEYCKIYFKLTKQFQNKLLNNFTYNNNYCQSTNMNLDCS